MVSINLAVFCIFLSPSSFSLVHLVIIQQCGKMLGCVMLVESVFLSWIRTWLSQGLKRGQ